MTMSKLAEILKENFGEINNRGCYTDNGAWLSLESVQKAYVAKLKNKLSDI